MTTMTEDLYPSRLPATGKAPPWLERRDPVVWRAWAKDAPVSAEQHAAFERDGFLVIENFLRTDEIAVLQGELARLRADTAGLERETLIAEPGSNALRSIFAIHRQSGVFSDLACDERLVAIAQHFLDDDVYVHQSRLNYKPGFTGKEFYWHSDFETWHTEDGMPRMRALSASLLLSDNSAVNGPLMLMPGSHRHFVTCVGETPENHYKHSLRKQEYGVPDEESLTRLAADGGIAAPTGKAGSLVLFDCNTMHGSNGNITPYPRANAFIVFNAVSNALLAPFAADAPRPDFIAARSDTRALAPRSGGIGRSRRAA